MASSVMRLAKYSACPAASATAGFSTCAVTCSAGHVQCKCNFKRVLCPRHTLLPEHMTELLHLAAGPFNVTGNFGVVYSTAGLERSLHARTFSVMISACGSAFWATSLPMSRSCDVTCCVAGSISSAKACRVAQKPRDETKRKRRLYCNKS